jgi:hypothetical protein
VQKNLAPYGERAQVILGGVWPRCANLTLVRRSCEANAQVRESLPGDDPGDQIQGWDIPYLLEIGQMSHIDLLKIDIEGAELELMTNGADRWLPLTRNICIELHGKDCERAFFKALEGYEFDSMQSGELTICSNLRRRQPPIGTR